MEKITYDIRWDCSYSTIFRANGSDGEFETLTAAKRTLDNYYNGILSGYRAARADLRNLRIDDVES